MSRRCKNTAGGSESTTATRKLESGFCKSEENIHQVTQYKSRLRPRPTRQTDYFRSPSLKRKKESNCAEPDRELNFLQDQPPSALVRQNRASVLRQNALLASKHHTGGVETRQLGKSDSAVAAKRARSDPALTTASKRPKKKVLSKVSSSTNQEIQPKGKEVTTKLWFPFIPPVTSSDSEEDEESSKFSHFGKVVSSSSATSNNEKLASRSTKSTFTKGSSKEKAGNSSSTKSNTSVGSSTTKVSASKSSTRFSFGRFSKSDSSSKNNEDKEAGTSATSQSSKSRSSSAKQAKSSKGKLSSKTRHEESKPKTRKRYQSPPNHSLYSSRTFTNTSKTGSCASTSRRGRGKASSSARNREESGASEMSREAGQAPEENQANQPEAAAADNQQGAPPALPAAAAADNNANPDPDLADPDMSRLQALLEARGLPSHFFGALGPRVQQILHRSVNSGTNSKSQQLLQGMQATGDESRQLQSVIEMCQLLVMGNEDTLSGFPVKMAVPTLITLLKMEHNFDIMNHACRALTYMMEALPRSSGVVVDAVPVFLEKLQSIQCMDVAEQSLTALEMLSRRHSAAILRSNGLSSCLLYLDFFSLPAQRNALAVAANCCTVLSPSEHAVDFDKYYGSSISMLVQRLSHHDKKCVESICLCFARLVDNFRNHPEILQKITNDGLLENFQTLLVVTPPLIGSNTFVMVIRTMCLLCSSCPNLATQLVRNNIAETLRYLLCGTATEIENIELVPRSPQELYEITSLIGELMPRLPLDDPMFGIDRLLKHSKQAAIGGLPAWQWRGDDGVWRPYNKHDNRMIEETHKSGDHEASLLIQGRVYMLDFNMMQQINEDTGNSRPIRRQANDKEQNDASAVKSDSVSNIVDARVALVKDDHAVISQFVRSLFTLLYEVYGSSAGSPAVRHKCLRAVQRMIYYAEPELLRDVLKNLSVSSHIASMLSSNDLKVVVGALQMSMILMKKLPDVFEVYFRRQGVTHQVEQLLDEKHKVVGSDPSDSSPSGSAQVDAATMATPVFEGAPSSTNPSPMDAAPGRLSDVLRRKYPPRKSTVKKLSASSLTPTPEDPHPPGKHAFTRGRSGTTPSPADRVISPPLTKAKAFAAALSTMDGATDTPTGPKTKSGSNSARSSASSFFYNLNPVRWGRTSASSASGAASSSANSPQSVSSSSSSQAPSLSRENLSLPNLKKNLGSKENREEVKQWIREQAKMFLDKYFVVEDVDSGSRDDSKMDEHSLLKQLTTIAQTLVACTNISEACDRLRLFSNIINTSDVSSFELQHSGIISSLIIFLTVEESDGKKENTSLRKIKSATTPPMATRRRSKLKPPPISEIGKTPSLEEHRPKSASSEDAGQCVTDSSSSQNDVVLLEMESTDKKYTSDSNPVTLIDRDERLRTFLSVFVGLPDNHFSTNPISVSELNDLEFLKNLIEKLNLCVNQLEQFAVRSHDLPSAPGRGSQALTFFAKHQLKCQLQRHPDCSKGRQWHSGPVRVDPLALVQAIERYLITRGYGAASSDEKSHPDRRDIFMLMDEEDSEDEIEVDEDDGDDDELNPLATSTSTHATAGSGSSTSHKHRLELYIGSHKLPYNMTVYQAVKHFSEEQGRSPLLLMSSDRDTDDEMMVMSNNNIWNSTHTIYYRLVADPDGQTATSGGNKKGSQKLSPKSHKRNDALYLHGLVPQLKRPLDRYLSNSFPYESVSTDPSQEVLCLMRILFGLTLHWHNLYASSTLRSDRELLPKAEFVSSKLSMKAHRQLQDPLMILTGELPPWLSDLAHCCPFIFSFETRQLLFRIVSFDRDRAMQYLYDTGSLPDTNGPSSSAPSSSMGSDSSQRFVPKIEKKKCVVKRESLLHQAEKILQDHGNARSLLEVQYEGEVGTGLGPTLEFYTLTSHELQKVELGLWRSDEKSDSIESNRNAEPASLKKMAEKMSDIVEEEEPPALPDNTFVHSPVGLYPVPIGRSTKFSAISKVKNKFRFLGKLLAKSAMDGRMVDIPLSVVCYKWLLGKENEITWFDLDQVDPGFTLTFNKLKNVLYQRLVVEREATSDMEKKVSAITMDGCSLEDLGLDFLLPGFPNIELMKGGSKMSLSISNIDKYLSLIAYWTLFEGVRHQLEAFREGFQSVFSLRNIDYFYAEEFDELFCGARYQPWSERELADCCQTDHGYTHDSETVKTLFRVLSQYDVTEQRSFLQFVTGSPHLPVGGLRALHPQLTIVRKSSEEGHSPDEYLPSVMTCVNYLKLPEYSSESIMRQRLTKAAREGQKSFLLS